MFLKWLKGCVLNRLEVSVKVKEESWNTCRTKLWAQSTQQFGQHGSSVGMEEQSSLCDKTADSLSPQWNESFSPQPNTKQSPGNMHKRNHITRIPLRPSFKNIVFSMFYKLYGEYFQLVHTFAMIIINPLQKQAKNNFWFTLSMQRGILPSTRWFNKSVKLRGQFLSKGSDYVFN